jgi:hypothetical protein
VGSLLKGVHGGAVPLNCDTSENCVIPADTPACEQSRYTTAVDVTADLLGRPAGALDVTVDLHVVADGGNTVVFGIHAA